jgi:hypothetical protein
MMRLSPGYLLIAVFALALAGSSRVAHAQAGANGDVPTRGPSSPVRTGKERLGNKWSDEQRVDNCKVPPEKRGTKPRPDACAEVVTH